MSVSSLPVAPGTYLLVLLAAATARLRVGALGEMALSPGFYLYVGSAFGPGGLRARVRRHFDGQGALRWHVDYLRRTTQPVEAWCAPGVRCEHAWAQSLAVAAGLPLARFGASDCRCPAHLFYLAQRPDHEWLLELLKTGAHLTGEIRVFSALD
jgi:Uri superfamily endonuclease